MTCIFGKRCQDLATVAYVESVARAWQQWTRVRHGVLPEAPTNLSSVFLTLSPLEWTKRGMISCPVIYYQ